MCDGEFENCCRICLDVESEHLSIFDNAQTQLHIKTCLSISISPGDSLPKRICVNCASQLREFYNMQLNARCSQDWLESCLLEKSRKPTDMKTLVQPLPDSEYNSDSLLEFLNSTANIDDYLSNVGKEDIPSIVNMLDRNHENSLDSINKIIKTSPKKREPVIKLVNPMKFDVLDSDFEIVKEILIRETEKPKPKPAEKSYNCFGCKAKFDDELMLSQHIAVCDTARRTCWFCNALFDSKEMMLQHIPTHCSTLPVTCHCGNQFMTKDSFTKHYKTCTFDNLPKTTYRCKKCSATFKDRLLLYRHAKNHIMQESEKVCDICSHLFENETALRAHREKDHSVRGEQTYRCKVCGHTSKNRLETYAHVQKHVQSTTKQQRHLCETCGQSYTSKASLLRHMDSHHAKTSNGLKKPDFNGPIMCEKCGVCVDGGQIVSHSCVSSITLK